MKKTIEIQKPHSDQIFSASRRIRVVTSKKVIIHKAMQIRAGVTEEKVAEEERRIVKRTEGEIQDGNCS